MSETKTAHKQTRKTTSLSELKGALHRLSEDLYWIHAHIEAHGGELTPEMEEQLDSRTIAFEQKMQEAGLVAELLTSQLAELLQWQKRVDEAVATTKKGISSLQFYMVRKMLQAKVSEVTLERDDLPPVTWYLSQGRGRTVCPPEAVKYLPESCVRTKVEPDLVEVRRLLDAKVPMPKGVEIRKDWTLKTK